MCCAKFAVAARDLFGQPRGLGGVFLCLINESLNGAGDPILERGIGVKTGQFRFYVLRIKRYYY